MPLNGGIQLDALARLELAIQRLPGNLRTRRKSIEMRHRTPLDLFEDENIFRPDGTYHYDGEKIDNFRSQIFLLLLDLFPTGETHPPTIRLLGQGSFNLVVGVHVEPKSTPSNNGKFSNRVLRLFGTPPKPKTFALRIPMESWLGFNMPLGTEIMGDINQDIACLQVVGERLTLPIPRILEHDVTSANALGRPWMLQTYLEGKSLMNVWSKLNPKQKVSAVEEMTRIVEKIASVTAPAAGQIARSNVTSPGEIIKLDEFPIPTRDQAEIELHELLHPTRDQAERQPDTALPERCEASEETPHDFLIRCCSRWIRHEERAMKGNSFTTALWEDIMKIINSLEKMGWLGNRFHLMHGDFFARNILVDVIDETTVKVTGIIDWDMACFVPKFAALRAPFWAWNGTESDETDEDGARTGAYGKETKEIKEAFLNTASPEYVTMALADEAVIARKIFKVVTDGLLTARQRRLAIGLAGHWNRICPKEFATKSAVA